MMFALAAGGCGSSPTAAPDLQTLCRDDAVCGGKTPRCDRSTGQCVACTQDSHCPVGQICRGNACIAGCSAQRGCGDAGVCDTDAGVCRSCAADADCPSWAPRCDTPNRRCVPCLPEKDNCPAGQNCVVTDDGYACTMGCKDDAECAPMGKSFACCDHACVNLATTNTHCGACGKACMFPSACCGAQCNDFQRDPLNCGACGKACSLPNAMSTCAAGKCTVSACDPGFGDCNGQGADGCEVTLGGDPRNCGACGMACSLPNAVQGCNAAMCVVAGCKPGFADCNMDSQDGCEVSLANDARNCGGCGKTCNVPNAGAGCVAGLCTVASCNGAFADCDKTAQNGCEIDTARDVMNCGACGMACGNVPGGTPTCKNGACAVGMCAPPLGDCDMFYGNGCESDTSKDVMNCGGCGMVCAPANANGACVMGVCKVGACLGAFADCNMMPGDGCEVDAATNVANCGGCGRACGAVANGAAACVKSACTVAMCKAGYGDCDLVFANGCEAAFASDDRNCGGCGMACGALQKCDAGKCVFKDFGSGADGAVNVAAGQTLLLNLVRTNVTGNAGQAALTVTSTSGFVAGQSVLLHQTQGMTAGLWELSTVASIGNGTITLVAPIKNTYTNANGALAQMVVVPQYTNLNIAAGGTVSAPAWDGSTGGILAIQATGTVTVSGTITMDGKGFRGTTHACFYRCTQGVSGESATGAGSASVSANGAGGGGGQPGQDCGAGGGGGHNGPGIAGSAGTVGACAPNPHLGGSAGLGSGAADLIPSIFFGGAGGEGGGDEDGANPGGGGNGGGLVVLYTANLNVIGAISNAGLRGVDGNQGACGGTGCGMGGGGGGAGGAIRIVANTAALGIALVGAPGGGGGVCTCGNAYPGGNGAPGRIAVKSTNITGTTNPPFFGG